MILNDVLDAGPRRERRVRVGRGIGSGLGKTCGRGQHGAYSRSGNSMKLGFQGGTMRFFRRIPRRGFNNAAFRVKWDPVNVGVLDSAFQAGETVTLAAAIARGAVKRNAERLKVLGDGEITKALILDPSVAASASARAKIEKAGGKVLMPLPKKPAPDWKGIAAAKARAAKAAAAATEKAEKADKAEKGEKGEPKKPRGDDRAAKPEGRKGGDEKQPRAEKRDHGEKRAPETKRKTPEGDAAPKKKK